MIAKPKPPEDAGLQAARQNRAPLETGRATTFGGPGSAGIGTGEKGRPARPLAFALPVLLGCALAARAAGTADLFENPVRARGRGFEIRQSDIDDMVVSLKATLSATRGQTIPEAQRGQIAAQMLDRLVLLRLVRFKATDADLAKAKETADKFVADTRSKARSEEAYRRQLIAAGIKPDVFESRAFEQAIMETVLDRELKTTVTVTDRQVSEFYDSGVDSIARQALQTLPSLAAEKGTNSTTYTDAARRVEDIKKSNLARLDRPEQVKSQVIVVHTIDRLTRDDLPDPAKAEQKQKIQKALSRLRNGEDFTTVAREVSEDPDVAKTGGEYTTVRDAVAYPELRAALFTLPIGEVSEPIATRVGFYLAKVLDRTPAGKLAFAAAEKDIRDLLLNQEVQTRLPDFFDRLKKEFDVVYPGATNAPPAR
jgi:parvulin-like peptidyl-prolyl isomerase